MSKKTKKETAPEVQNPEEQTQQPVVEQSVVDGSPVNNAPAYVKDLLEKGVVVLSGRSPEELSEMIDNIPSDCSYYAGCITKSYDTGLYRIQVNRKED